MYGDLPPLSEEGRNSNPIRAAGSRDDLKADRDKIFVISALLRTGPTKSVRDGEEVRIWTKKRPRRFGQVWSANEKEQKAQSQRIRGGFRQPCALTYGDQSSTCAYRLA